MGRRAPIGLSWCGAPALPCFMVWCACPPMLHGVVRLPSHASWCGAPALPCFMVWCACPPKLVFSPYFLQMFLGERRRGAATCLWLGVGSDVLPMKTFASTLPHYYGSRRGAATCLLFGVGNDVLLIKTFASTIPYCYDSRGGRHMAVFGGRLQRASYENICFNNSLLL